jgi:hypothetical protein
MDALGGVLLEHGRVQSRSDSGRVRELALGQLLSGLLDLLKRVLLLFEVLRQQPDDVLLAHRLGLGDQALVHRDLVVLGLGGTRQDHGIDDAVIGLLDVRLAFLVDALDGWARAVVGLLAERPERLLEVGDLLARLLGVVPELLLELVLLGGLFQVAEHLEHGVFHRERRAELEVEQILRCLELLEHERFLSRLPAFASTTRRLSWKTAGNSSP